jgi:peptidoglycan/LPS O-acetylase OafA/YrhL
LVVLHHFAIYDRYGARRTPLDAILGGGSVGVNFFFVLSGFILAYTYLDGYGKLQCNERAFWLARVVRIYHVYLLAWIAAARAALLLESPNTGSGICHRDLVTYASTVLATTGMGDGMECP